MTTLRNSLFAIGAGIACAAILLVHAMYSEAQPSSVTFQTQALATSTLAYMTPGTATTTYQIDNQTFSSGKVASMQNIDSAAMYIITSASTSVAKLDFQVQVSNNNIDWYPISVASSSVSTGGGQIYIVAPTASTSAYEYNAGTSATTTIEFSLPIVPAQHERLVFSDPIGASNIGFYTEYDLKKLPSTP